MTAGAQLRQARTEQRQSIADVSNQTKIQPWVLEALEADRLQHEMSPIYVKGFLMTYARHLHLAFEPLLAQLTWPDAAKEEAAVAATTFAPPTSPDPAFSWPKLSWPSLPSISWEPVQGWWRRSRPVLLLACSVAAVVAIKPLRWLPSLKLPAHREASVSVVVPQPMPKPTLETVKLQPVQPLEVALTVHGATWIRVRADGKLLSQQRLPRGATERWTAKRRLELVVAKPLQVEVSLNGQPISPMVVAHQGRLLITHDGVSQLPDDEF